MPGPVPPGAMPYNSPEPQHHQPRPTLPGPPIPRLNQRAPGGLPAAMPPHSNHVTMPTNNSPQHFPPAPPPHAVPRDLRPTHAVEISDIRDEGLTEDDARERLSTYKVMRFEKVAKSYHPDDEGYPMKPTWEKVLRTEQTDVSQQDARRKVRQLQRETKPVLEKKAAKSVAIQRQLERAREELTSRDPDPRYCYKLVQFESLFRKVDDRQVVHIGRHKDRKDRRDRKYAKYSKRSRSPTKERYAIIAFYKRTPAPGNSTLKMLEEHSREQSMKHEMAMMPPAQHPHAQQKPAGFPPAAHRPGPPNLAPAAAIRSAVPPMAPRADSQVKPTLPPMPKQPDHPPPRAQPGAQGKPQHNEDLEKNAAPGKQGTAPPPHDLPPAIPAKAAAPAPPRAPPATAPPMPGAVPSTPQRPAINLPPKPGAVPPAPAVNLPPKPGAVPPGRPMVSLPPKPGAAPVAKLPPAIPAPKAQGQPAPTLPVRVAAGNTGDVPHQQKLPGFTLPPRPGAGERAAPLKAPAVLGHPPKAAQTRPPTQPVPPRPDIIVTTNTGGKGKIKVYHDSSRSSKSSRSTKSSRSSRSSHSSELSDDCFSADESEGTRPSSISSASSSARRDRGRSPARMPKSHREPIDERDSRQARRGPEYMAEKRGPALPSHPRIRLPSPRRRRDESHSPRREFYPNRQEDAPEWAPRRRAQSPRIIQRKRSVRLVSAPEARREIFADEMGRLENKLERARLDDAHRDREVRRENGRFERLDEDVRQRRGLRARLQDRREVDYKHADQDFRWPDRDAREYMRQREQPVRVVVRPSQHHREREAYGREYLD
ncbi:hypothetical protein ACJ41O_011280 [Fusarium nematophilum]